MKLLLLAALALAWMAGPAAAQDSPGRALFNASDCRACHRVGSKGGTSGPDLTYAGFRHSREWLEVWLKDPRAWKKDTLMPNSRLSPKARAAIVDYLSSLKGQDYAQSGAPWNNQELASDPVKMGRMIYDKAGCVACHGPKGMGGRPNNNVPGGLIPGLNNVSETYTLKELKLKIRRGVKPQKADPKGPEPLVFMPPWGEVLKDREIDAVAAYLLSLGSGKSKASEW